MFHTYKHIIINSSLRKKTFIGLLLFCNGLINFASAYTQNFEKLERIALSQQWLKFIRYEKKSLGRYVSEVDSKNYFLSPDGKRSPLKELVATVIAFNDNKKIDDDHPICKFPGRYLLLNRLGLIDDRGSLAYCSEFQKYKNKINVKTISLIFSSFYINKPASAFGHTLLKFNSTESGDSDLHDYGVDFAAQVTTKNPLLYGFMGIFGGFYGRFSLLPYFLKIREYNDYESRDLWEFTINFNPEDIELAVAHLWDMNLAAFKYYYFQENCSYHILRLIDAIRPDWNLMNKLGSIIIPIDTVSPFIENPSTISSIAFRPSASRKVLSKINELSKKEKKIVKSLLNNPTATSLPNKMSDKAKLLDTAIEVYDYKYAKELLLKEITPTHQQKLKLLARRSQIDIKSKTNNKFHKKNINIPHTPRLLSTGHRLLSRKGINLNFRHSLHEITEPTGDIYSQFSLIMNNWSAFISQQDQRLYLDRYEFAKVVALRPVTFLEKNISWKFDIGAKSDYIDYRRVGIYSELGIGYAFKTQIGTFYPLIEIQTSHILSRDERFRRELGSSINYLYQTNNTGIAANYLYSHQLDKLRNKFHHYQINIYQNIAKKLRAGIKWNRRYNQSELSLNLGYYL